MLVHKGGHANQQCAIDHWVCHNYKIAVSSVQRMEVIVKMLKKGRKSQGEGGMCTKNGSYCEKEKKVSGGGGGGGGGGVRVDVNGEVKLL